MTETWCWEWGARVLLGCFRRERSRENLRVLTWRRKLLLPSASFPSQWAPFLLLDGPRRWSDYETFHSSIKIPAASNLQEGRSVWALKASAVSADGGGDGVVGPSIDSPVARKQRENACPGGFLLLPHLFHRHWEPRGWCSPYAGQVCLPRLIHTRNTPTVSHRGVIYWASRKRSTQSAWQLKLIIIINSQFKKISYFLICLFVFWGGIFLYVSQAGLEPPL